MVYQDLAILALFVLVYSSIAGRVERTWISGPIVFTLFGLIIGPVALNLLSFKADGETIRTLAELTLALVLFTDAASADMGVLRRTEALPIRLLLIGLPLTILLGFGVGVLLFKQLSLVEIALLATMLAPTDAALGKAVVTNEAVPDAVRQGLNVESGLNDGICVPILFVFLALATGKAGEGGPWQLAMKLVAEEIGIGLAVGLALTAMAALLLKFAKGQKWLTNTWIQIPVVALAFGCFAVAQFLGGSGFIAAFSGGLLFGALAKQHREEFLLAAPYRYPHVAGFSFTHRYGGEHRGQVFYGLVRSTWFGQYCFRCYRGECSPTKQRSHRHDCGVHHNTQHLGSRNHRQPLGKSVRRTPKVGEKSWSRGRLTITRIYGS